MFMAGVRLPFPSIVRELLSFLHVTHVQLIPNGWRYFFFTFISSCISMASSFESLGETKYFVGSTVCPSGGGDVSR
jgi:hypothetical protein